MIDDGSHLNEHVITPFRTLFPLLAEDGIYVIEDTQTSYWPKFGGDSYNLNNANTIMNFLSLHFYHNLVFIYKGRNEEGSNSAHEHFY
jgi:demethylmacrocin O-methyltransferase